MCGQYKGLIGCSKNGSMPGGKLTVAEILAKALRADDKERFVSTPPRTRTRRESAPTSLVS